MNKNGKIKNIAKTDWAAMVILFAVAIFTLGAGRNDGKLHLYFLDVGQGDAIFVKTPIGGQILIDGGPDDNIIRELGGVMPFYDKSIDMIVLTHPDADHLNGLIKVLERYKVEKILETGITCDTPQCVRWEEEKRKEDADNFFVYFGNKIYSEDGVGIEVLHPFENAKGKKVSQKNNSAVVLKIAYGAHSVLLAADIEKPVERKLVLGRAGIDSDFLKIPHHGSKTSTTEEFLRSVSPIAAFIEVGAKNRYGHPAEEVIDRLESFSIPYYRTDIDGRVELTLDGSNYKIYTNAKN